MTARRKAAAIAALGVAPLALTGLTASPAAAHGSMSDPVSRVAACFAEGPESPKSAACKAAVAASGTQAFYDWNEVNIGDAAGRHRQIIPDGKLCSAGRDKYKGLDLPRADWPASSLNSGAHTFQYKATAPHKGSFELYITKDGYDPGKPLTWADLETTPFAKVADPQLQNGAYVFQGTVPQKSGRHLIYSIWQRSDSPEAFYTCSDVTFGGSGSGGSGGSNGSGTAGSTTGGTTGGSAEGGSGSGGSTGGGSGDSTGGTGSPADDQPAAPTEEQVEQHRDKSTVDHDGHGGDQHGGKQDDAEGAKQKGGAEGEAEGAEPQGGAEPTGSADSGEDQEKVSAEQVNLAETGGEENTTMIAAGGAAALLLGAGVVLATMRRRALGRHRG
ncbi:lytic polysaccharide monooxygenase [Streptomyces sp. 549]|uniref:lytic polysaccharide monooxygenase auxiliary activity family 9 protein n=1 Tax=Streptomyces sp. 549 TaxID=3049076 RepID=UPI0024C3460B|nr:lytic polysaccharide monooxygenase [Streptomyces sp. 549]MDK1475673.1 lytic polysaccharide monooxygenase [Streptomyces sp. 549]